MPGKEGKTTERNDKRPKNPGALAHEIELYFKKLGDPGEDFKGILKWTKGMQETLGQLRDDGLLEDNLLELWMSFYQEIREIHSLIKDSKKLEALRDNNIAIPIERVMEESARLRARCGALKHAAGRSTEIKKILDATDKQIARMGRNAMRLIRNIDDIEQNEDLDSEQKYQEIKDIADKYDHGLALRNIYRDIAIESRLDKLLAHYNGESIRSDNPNIQKKRLLRQLESYALDISDKEVGVGDIRKRIQEVRDEYASMMKRGLFREEDDSGKKINKALKTAIDNGFAAAEEALNKRELAEAADRAEREERALSVTVKEYPEILRRLEEIYDEALALERPIEGKKKQALLKALDDWAREYIRAVPQHADFFNGDAGDGIVNDRLLPRAYVIWRDASKVLEDTNAVPAQSLPHDWDTNEVTKGRGVPRKQSTIPSRPLATPVVVEEDMSDRFDDTTGEVDVPVGETLISEPPGASEEDVEATMVPEGVIEALAIEKKIHAAEEEVENIANSIFVGSVGIEQQKASAKRLRQILVLADELHTAVTHVFIAEKEQSRLLERVMRLEARTRESLVRFGTAPAVGNGHAERRAAFYDEKTQDAPPLPSPAKDTGPEGVSKAPSTGDDNADAGVEQQVSDSAPHVNAPNTEPEDTRHAIDKKESIFDRARRGWEYVTRKTAEYHKEYVLGEYRSDDREARLTATEAFALGVGAALGAATGLETVPKLARRFFTPEGKESENMMQDIADILLPEDQNEWEKKLEPLRERIEHSKYISTEGKQRLLEDMEVIYRQYGHDARKQKQLLRSTQAAVEKALRLYIQDTRLVDSTINTAFNALGAAASLAAQREVAAVAHSFRFLSSVAVSVYENWKEARHIRAEDDRIKESIATRFKETFVAGVKRLEGDFGKKQQIEAVTALARSVGIGTIAAASLSTLASDVLEEFMLRYRHEEPLDSEEKITSTTVSKEEETPSAESGDVLSTDYLPEQMSTTVMIEKKPTDNQEPPKEKEEEEVSFTDAARVRRGDGLTHILQRVIKENAYGRYADLQSNDEMIRGLNVTRLLARDRLLHTWIAQSAANIAVVPIKREDGATWRVAFIDTKTKKEIPIAELYAQGYLMKSPVKE